MKIINRISDILKTLGAICLTAMMLLTCVDVLGRFFDHPIFGTMEIVSILATLAIAMGLAFTHETDGHVGVELLLRLLSKRMQAAISLGTSILSLGLFGIMTWQMALYARSLQKSGEVSINLKLPEYLVVYLISFCLIILTLTILRDVIHHITNLRSK